MGEFYRAHSDQVRFLGIDLADDRQAALAMAAQTKMTFPSVQDPNSEVRAGLRVVGVPTTLFVRPDGSIARANECGFLEGRISEPDRQIPAGEGVASATESAGVEVFSDLTDLPAWYVPLITGLQSASPEELVRFRAPDEEKVRHSAVLVLFADGSDIGESGPDVLLIERAADMRSHAGQPAFPGGRRIQATTVRSRPRCARRRKRPAWTRQA